MTAEIIQPEKPRKWYEIWWDVWIHPGMAPFKTLLTEPGKNTTRGFIWIAVTSLITALVSYLFSTLVTQNWMSDLFGTEISNNFGGYALYSICGIILSPLFAIIGISISAAIYHWIASFFHGKGNWSDMVYSLSAVAAPAALIGGIVGVFAMLFFKFPVLIFLPSLVAFAFGIYTIILNVNAIKVTEDIGTWEAIASMFIPVIIIVAIATCCTFAILIPVITTAVRSQ
jgi:hypothetical protein